MRVTVEEKETHGCHSNCVIMLVAIMKALKTAARRMGGEGGPLTLEYVCVCVCVGGSVN